MPETLDLTKDLTGHGALGPSELRDLVSSLGDQVLWFGRIGDSQVVMVAPARGGKAAELRRCLEAAVGSARNDAE